MGIPKFYRWLTKRYPLCVSGIKYPHDMPPIDNLYLDLNGLIHMAIHGNSPDRHLITSRLINSGNIDDLWSEIYRYIDEVVSLVLPRKLLFLAVDSVTPATKMVQQRARRIKEVSSNDEMLEKARESGEKEFFDINAISPGTEFMRQLNEKLTEFVKKKLSQDPNYQRVKIILSDSNVPGEGEHKIMSYLRQYKASPDYDPNIRHCIYGMDADLIMLALVSHEPNTIIIREVIEGKNPAQALVKGIQRATLAKSQQYEILYVNVLREYFEIEYAEFKGKMKIEWNLERIIDDFVFFSLFVGNDFVPYLCTVDINYGSLDEIIKFYKKILPELDSYITHKGNIMWSQADKIFKEVAKYEQKHLNYRYSDSIKLMKNELKSNAENAQNGNKEELRAKLILEKKKAKIELLKSEGKLREYIHDLKLKFPKLASVPSENSVPMPSLEASKSAQEAQPTVNEKISEIFSNSLEPPKIYQLEKTESVQEELKINIPAEQIIDIKPEEIPDSEISDIDENEFQENEIELLADSAEKNKAFFEKICNEYKTDVNNARHVYYEEKLGFDMAKEDGKEKINIMIKRYLEGLQWVLYYYYVGVKHWGWFYPYHYAPLMSDIINPQLYFKDGEELNFEHLNVPNEPITPFQQLVSILPKYSRNLLPICYHSLYDEGSEISHYYPSTFHLDYNGRDMPWEAIKIIPFVDTRKIIACEKIAISKIPSFQFSSNEIARNTLHKSFEFCFDQTANNIMQREYEISSKVPGFQPLLSEKYALCYDFPSLNYLSVSGCRIEPIRAREKTIDCVELVIKNTNPDIKHETLLKDPMYIGYPFKKEAAIIGIVTRNSYICLTEDLKRTYTEKIKDAKHYFDDARNLLDENYLIGTDIKYVCVCQPMETLNKNYIMGGIYEKYYSEEITIVPDIMIMTERSKNHYQNIDSLIESQQKAYPINSDCVLLAEPYFGAVGKILNNRIYGSLMVRINDIPEKIIPQNADIQNDSDFITIQNLAYKLGYSTNTISRITSSIKVFIRKPNTPKSQMKKYNIGLSIKSQTQGMHIPYHVKYDAYKNKWLVSTKIVEIIEAYIKEFPEVFKALEKNGKLEYDEPLFSDTIFPFHAEPEEKLKDILFWISQLEISKLPYVPVGTKLYNSRKPLPAQAAELKQIENYKTVKVLIKNVFVETYPYWTSPFDENSYYYYQLGDRVINVKSGDVPFGLKGIIAGLHNGKIVVEFDKEIITGGTYWGQCKKGCGKLVDAKSVINLNLKQRTAKKARLSNKSSQFGQAYKMFRNQKEKNEKQDLIKIEEEKKIEEPKEFLEKEVKTEEIKETTVKIEEKKQEIHENKSYYKKSQYYGNYNQNQQYYDYYYGQQYYQQYDNNRYYEKQYKPKLNKDAVAYKKKDPQ